MVAGHPKPRFCDLKLPFGLSAATAAAAAASSEGQRLPLPLVVAICGAVSTRDKHVHCRSAKPPKLRSGMQWIQTKL